MLAKKHGVPFGTIKAKSMRERWVAHREQHQAQMMEKTERKYLERDSERRTKILEQAAERHMREGRNLQDAGEECRVAGLVRLTGKAKCPNCGGEVPVPEDNVKATDALRAATVALDKGVAIERKALGIADRIELDYRTTEITKEVIQVLEMFITDADLMENIVYKLSQIGKKEREELAKITAGGDVDELKS